MSTGNVSIPRQPILYGERDINITIDKDGNSMDEIEESTGLIVTLHRSTELLKYLLFATARIVDSTGATVSSYDASASAIITEDGEETEVRLHIYKYSANVAKVHIRFTMYHRYLSIYNLGVNYISASFNSDSVSDLISGTYTFKIKFTAIPII